MIWYGTQSKYFVDLVTTTSTKTNDFQHVIRLPMACYTFPMTYGPMAHRGFTGALSWNGIVEACFLASNHARTLTLAWQRGCSKVFRCRRSRSCILSSRVFLSGHPGKFSLTVQRSKSQPLRTRPSIQNVSLISFQTAHWPIHAHQVPHTVLCRPRNSNITLTHELLEKLVTHFKILFSTPDKRLTVDNVRPYVRQAQMDQWGKVRRAFGGDTIQSVMATRRRDNIRDSSFVRVSLIIL